MTISKDALIYVDMIDTHDGRAPLLNFLPGHTLPNESLLSLTGDRSKVELHSRSAYRSGVEIRVSAAWQTVLNEITCAQCRVLVGQKLGLPWLSAPVAEFVSRYPKAECDLFQGDMTVNALIAWREMARHAPEQIKLMLAADYEWLRQEAAADSWSGSILKQAARHLKEAREMDDYSDVV